MKLPDTGNRVLDADLPRRANRATRRACAKTGHRWKSWGDGSVSCADCGEDR